MALTAEAVDNHRQDDNGDDLDDVDDEEEEEDSNKVPTKKQLVYITELTRTPLSSPNITELTKHH